MEAKLKCHLLESTPTQSDLDSVHENFINVKTLVEDGHIFRRILKCNRCGQLYFYEFYEEIDWVEGNDPQYITYIPVDTIEEAQELNNKSQMELLAVSPRLQSDFLQDGAKTIKWVR